RTRENDEVAFRQSLPGRDHLQINQRMQSQCIEIGVVADARIHRHDDAQNFAVALLCLLCQYLLLRDRILRLQMPVGEIGQHPEHFFVRVLLQPLEPGLQQADIAAKAVDDKAEYTPLLAGRQQLQRTHEMGEDAAAIDVGDQQHRTVDGFGEAHVGDVAIAQVDFRRTAGALDDDHVVLRAQPLMRFEHRMHRNLFVIVIRARFHRADRPAVNDYLGAGVAVRFQQHRIHVGVRIEKTRLRLHRLRATYFATVDGDGTVERHVLWLERCNAYAAPRQHATNSRNQRAFSGIRSGALNHQCLCHRKVCGGASMPPFVIGSRVRCGKNRFAGRGMDIAQLSMAQFWRDCSAPHGTGGFMAEIKHIGSLDGLRGFAASAVVFTHIESIYTVLAPIEIAKVGEQGVAIFFALSGFLMAYLYGSKPFSRPAAADYLVSRFARIYPVYLFAVLVCALLSAWPGLDYIDHLVGPVEIIRHVAMLGSQGVFWSIPPEIQFYLFFLLLWYCFANPQKSQALLAAIACLFAVAALLKFPGPGIMLLSKLPYFL